MTNLERAKLDPSSVYRTPAEIIDDDLSLPDKIDILRRWAYDELDKLVAEEENMPSPNEQSSKLDDVLKALHQLGAAINLNKRPPTKQGEI